MATGFKLKRVPANELPALMSQRTSGGRSSRGQELVDQFLASGQTAASVELRSTKERDGLAISAANYIRRGEHRVWIRKSSPIELLLINLAKAPADVVKAHSARPRVGRRPVKKS